MDKLHEEFGLLDYYSIVTSETNMADEAIIETYHNLVEIEDEFRVMKMSLHARPLYVRSPEHISAHLIICTLALLFVRIIQNKLKAIGKPLSAERIRVALSNLQVERLVDELYRFNHLTDPDVSAILDAFHIEITKKLHRIGELKHLKQTIPD